MITCTCEWPFPQLDPEDGAMDHHITCSAGWAERVRTWDDALEWRSRMAQALDVLWEEGGEDSVAYQTLRQGIDAMRKSLKVVEAELPRFGG